MKKKLLTTVAVTTIVCAAAFTLFGCGGNEKPVTYTVTYEKGASDATGTAPAAVSYAEGTEITVAANVFSREGYTFKTWSDGTTTYDAGAKFTMPAKNVTFTAQWEAAAAQFTVVFKDGETTVATKIVAEGSEVELPDAPTAPAGKVFGGWFIKDTETEVTEGFKPTANIEAVARWDDAFTLVFKNGDEVHKTVLVVAGEKVRLPIAPEAKEGETFGGWFIKDTDTEVTVSFTPEADLEIVAKWNKKQQVTVTFKNGDVTLGTPQTLFVGDKITLPNTPTAPEGKELDGWYIVGTDTKVDGNFSVTETVVIEVRWKNIRVPSVGTTVDYNAGAWGTELPGWTLQRGEEITYTANYPTTSNKPKHGWFGLVVRVFADGLDTGSSYFIRPDGKATLDPWGWDTNKIEASFSPAYNEQSYINAFQGASVTAVARVADDGTVTVEYTFTGTDYSYTATYTFTTKTGTALVFFGVDGVIATTEDPNPISFPENGKLTIPDKERIVTVDLNGGTSEIELTQKVAVGAAGDPQFTLPAAPTMAKKDFIGWKVNNEATPTAAGEKVFLRDDITITAQWADKTYSVTYVGGADDDSIAGLPTDTAKYKEGAEVTISTTVPTRTGYTFAGWTATGVTIADGKFTMPEGAVELKATWTIQAFKVTYQAGEGVTGVEVPEEETVNFNTEITLEAAPTRAGFAFAGWLVGSDTKNPGDKITVTDNVMIVAQWIADNAHTITFAGGGDGVEGLPTGAHSAAKDEVVPLPAEVPTREGFVFNGWEVKNGDEPVAVTDGKFVMPDADVTVTATWTAVFSVTYVGGAEDDTIAGLPTDSAKYKAGAEVTVSTAVPTRTGYTFAGWTATGVTIIDGKFSMPEGAVELEATWTINRYTVTFKNGATEEKITKDFGSAIGTLPTADETKGGLPFAGWFIGDTKITEDYVVSADVIAEPKYQAVLGKSDFTGVWTGVNPEWIGEITPNTRLVLTGTMTSRALENWQGPTINLFKDETSSNLVFMRADNFVALDGNVVQTQTANGDFYLASRFCPDDWVAYKSIIANCKIKIIFDWHEDSEICITTIYTAADGVTTYTQIYTWAAVSGKTLSESYKIGLGSDNCYVVLDKLDKFTYNGTKVDTVVENVSANTTPANYHVYGDGILDLTFGKEIAIYGTQTSEVAENYHSLLFELTNDGGFTGRADNFGWVFGSAPLGNANVARFMYVQKADGSYSDSWDDYKLIAANCNFEIRASWLDKSMIEVRLVMTSEEGVYVVTYQLPINDMTKDTYNFHIGGENTEMTVTRYSIWTHNN